MLKTNFVAYISFIIVLIIGSIILYWQEYLYSETNETINEEDESNSILDKIKKVFNKKSETETEPEINDNPNSENNNKSDQLEGNWVCKLDNNGKNIEIVKPIENYVSYGGSRFAKIQNS